ncbi:TPA: hypothetical protein ACM5DY_004485 [Escherichia coli]
MNKIMNVYKNYIDEAKLKGVKFVSFHCPKCNQEIETQIAQRGEVWDSFSTCPHCEALFMKITSGSVVTAKVI